MLLPEEPGAWGAGAARSPPLWPRGAGAAAPLAGAPPVAAAGRGGPHTARPQARSGVRRPRRQPGGSRRAGCAGGRAAGPQQQQQGCPLLCAASSSSAAAASSSYSASCMHSNKKYIPDPALAPRLEQLTGSLGLRQLFPPPRPGCPPPPAPAGAQHAEEEAASAPARSRYESRFPSFPAFPSLPSAAAGFSSRFPALFHKRLPAGSAAAPRPAAAPLPAAAEGSAEQLPGCRHSAGAAGFREHFNYFFFLWGGEGGAHESPFPTFGAHFDLVRTLLSPGSVLGVALCEGQAGVCGHTAQARMVGVIPGLGEARRRILAIFSPYFGTYFASLPRSLRSFTSPSLIGKWFVKARENTLFI